MVIILCLWDVFIILLQRTTLYLRILQQKTCHFIARVIIAYFFRPSSGDGSPLPYHFLLPFLPENVRFMVVFLQSFASKKMLSFTPFHIIKKCRHYFCQE